MDVINKEINKGSLCLCRASLDKRLKQKPCPLWASIYKISCQDVFLLINLLFIP